jgi:hypothetical protein
MEYTPQYPTAGIMDWRQMVANSRLNLQHLQRIDRAAKDARTGLLFRYFKVPVADGAAYYQVVKVNKNTAKVKWCYGICLDDYVDEILGEGASIPIKKAEELVSRTDGIRRIAL